MRTAILNEATLNAPIVIPLRFLFHGTHPSTILSSRRKGRMCSTLPPKTSSIAAQLQSKPKIRNEDLQVTNGRNTHFPKPNMRRRALVENSGLLALASACRWLRAFDRSGYVRMVCPSASFPEALSRRVSMRGVAILAVSGSK